MAGRGPRPSPNARRTNNKDIEVKASEHTLKEKPEAPKLFKRAQYSTAVTRWWDTWAESPQADLFLPSDWERLQMLAPLVQAYWEEPKTSILAEIRLNEERLGATVRDRQSLRMTLKSNDNNLGSGSDAGNEDLPEGVASISRFRDAFGE